jgi:glycine/D-amino acid oxidase-like deaminating enzyme
MENIIVLGGGLIGSATAWELAQYGEKVLLIEQQDVTYKKGSSFGEARITRSLGAENDIFSYIQRKNIIEVQKLIDFLNTKSQNHHQMSDIFTTSPITYLYNERQQEAVNELNFIGQDDNYKYATGEAALSQFGMKIPETCTVVREYKTYSGSFNPRILISKLQDGIKAHGNEILYNHKVLAIVQQKNYYDIQLLNTQTGEEKNLQTHKIISAAGAYTGTLLEKIASVFKKIITPKRMFLSFFQIAQKRYEQYSETQKNTLKNGFPLFDQNQPMFYAMIDKFDANNSPIFKTGGHKIYHQILDMDNDWDKKPTKTEIEWCKNELFNYFTMLQIPIEKEDVEFYYGHSCFYSLTKTEIPLVTNSVSLDNQIDTNFIVIGGMSGIGAKGALTYGRLAADLLLKKEDFSPMYQKMKTALRRFVD